MTTDTPRLEAFERPFRVLHSTENYSPAAEVIDANGFVISSLLSPHKAKWLCDRLNATPPSAEAKPGLTEEERAKVAHIQKWHADEERLQDVRDLLAIITRLTTGGQKS